MTATTTAHSGATTAAPEQPEQPEQSEQPEQHARSERPVRPTTTRTGGRARTGGPAPTPRMSGEVAARLLASSRWLR